MNSTQQPDSLPLPEEELLGDPFQNDGAQQSVPPRRPAIEPVTSNAGDSNVRAPLRLAAAESQTPEPEPTGSMLRLLAAPINAPRGDEPKIVVHLTPTPLSQDTVRLKKSEPLTADVQLASASDEAIPLVDPSASTIRIRTEPVHARRAATQPIPKRKATFLR
jgi:hypothetical protein